VKHAPEPRKRQSLAHVSANLEGDNEDRQTPTAAYMTFAIDEEVMGFHFESQHSSILE
jgi:hypothetical protein